MRPLRKGKSSLFFSFFLAGFNKKHLTGPSNRYIKVKKKRKKRHLNKSHIIQFWYNWAFFHSYRESLKNTSWQINVHAHELLCIIFFCKCIFHLKVIILSYHFVNVMGCFVLKGQTDFMFLNFKCISVASNGLYAFIVNFAIIVENVQP